MSRISTFCAFAARTHIPRKASREMTVGFHTGECSSAWSCVRRHVGLPQDRADEGIVVAAEVMTVADRHRLGMWTIEREAARISLVRPSYTGDRHGQPFYLGRGGIVVAAVAAEPPRDMKLECRRSRRSKQRDPFNK